MKIPSKISVLQISHDYQGPFVSVCNEYAKALSDYRVNTIYLRGSPSTDISHKTGGDEVVFMDKQEGSLRGFKLDAMIRLYRYLRNNETNVIIAHRYKPLYLAGVLSYLFKNILVIGVIHEHRVFRRFHRRLFIGLFRTNVKLIAISESVKEDILRSCPFLSDGDRLSLLYHPMDIDAKERQLLDKDSARQALSLPEEAFVAGSVGRLVKKKNQQELIRAASFVINKGKKVYLAILGDGPLMEQLRDLAVNEGVADYILFKGYKEDAFRYMKAFDLFLFTSGAKEAFGIALLEAMMARVPILVSDNKGPMEVVGNTATKYRSGSIEDLGEKIIEAVDLDRCNRDAMVNSAYNRLKEVFSPERFKIELLSIPSLQNLIRQAST